MGIFQLEFMGKRARSEADKDVGDLTPRSSLSPPGGAGGAGGSGGSLGSGGSGASGSSGGSSIAADVLPPWWGSLALCSLFFLSREERDVPASFPTRRLVLERERDAVRVTDAPGFGPSARDGRFRVYWHLRRHQAIALPAVSDRDASDDIRRHHQAFALTPGLPEHTERGDTLPRD
jgi:hypothetical protein